MKAVPKVNTDGLYLEDTLVDDAFSGVVPFYAEIEPEPPADPEESEQEADEQPEEEAPEPEIAGYIVGVPVKPGLFLPRFDLDGWEAYRDAVDAALSEFQQAYGEWAALPEEERGEPPIYVAPVQPTLWIEGLTPEEIEEITRPQPQEPSEVDLLKERLAAAEARNEQLAEESTINQFALMELHMMILEMKEGGGPV
ncbi:hypothetical protein [Paenibacillus sp. Cedars]|uniref:hypothetical protein n=1 Tax=Paenibacillus sp. Cedars TaxID=1980674 RepID=UPI001163E9BC|nr:hypothetical protein [Paenibacillus sp. Cedars]AWP28700.1 hypothetical protein B9D94_19630 [Paenibacillus sp. Cedars]